MRHNACIRSLSDLSIKKGVIDVATIAEVARLAGVSVATVSRVINNPEIVTDQTRKKVEIVIKELNYEPNALGRNLRMAQSRLILTLIPSIENPFYTEIINGIEDVAIEHGYNILLCETNANPQREATYFSLVKNRLADGIISMDPTVDKTALLALDSRYPVVQCSEYDEDETIAYVTINNERAAYEAVNHLLTTGHSKIALINANEIFLYARQRRRGYDKALAEFGITLNEDWIMQTADLTFEEGQTAMRKILSTPERPTAVFAVSDILAIGALKEINTTGLRVPHDIAIVGFDKISFSNMTHPTLTTISQPRYEMGATAATMLIDKIQGKQATSQILAHELIVRGST